jgi:hypothetical protein
MRKQVEVWQRSELTDVTAKVLIYEAFVEGKLEAPKHLARTVHDLYFEPKYEEFRGRTIWSLSNAFTSAFKELDPIPQFKGKCQRKHTVDILSPQPGLLRDFTNSRRRNPDFVNYPHPAVCQTSFRSRRLRTRELHSAKCGQDVLFEAPSWVSLRFPLCHPNVAGALDHAEHHHVTRDA